MLRWLRHATVCLVLLLSVFIGFGNTDDITNTITIWQRLVGVAATVYAIFGLIALVGYWQRSVWLPPVLWVWAFLVIFTSALAATVYGATGGSSLLVVVASAALPALVLWAASGRARMPDDPFGGRHPTSHERLTGLPWDASYLDGPAPWDIGQPQPAIVRLAAEGGIVGAVLDAGCGTGENALHVASLGLSVLGVDVAETALAIARKKADDRGIEVEFAAADAFHLERLGRSFETVLDCGLFHTFDSDERPGYVASLAAVTERAGTLYVLCFSDDGPDTGPHPVTQEELRAAFNPSTGWNVIAIRPDRVQTRSQRDGAPAWFATIKRI